jgi:hypothetical protein
MLILHQIDGCELYTLGDQRGMHARRAQLSVKLPKIAGAAEHAEKAERGTRPRHRAGLSTGAAGFPNSVVEIKGKTTPPSRFGFLNICFR